MCSCPTGQRVVLFLKPKFIPDDLETMMEEETKGQIWGRAEEPEKSFPSLANRVCVHVVWGRVDQVWGRGGAWGRREVGVPQTASWDTLEQVDESLNRILS